MTLKTVLNEGKSSILHRVVKSSRFDPHRARFIRFLQTLRVGALRRALLFLAAIAPRSAAIDNRGCSYEICF